MASSVVSSFSSFYYDDVDSLEDFRHFLSPTKCELTIRYTEYTEEFNIMRHVLCKLLHSLISKLCKE